MSNQSIQVTDLIIYPIKSSSPYQLSSCYVKPTGLEHDRLIIVTDLQGNILTARECPNLLKLKCFLNEENLKILFPGQAPIELSYTASQNGPIREVTLFRTAYQAMELGENYDAWISNCLGKPCKLLMMSKSTPRQIKEKYGTREEDLVSFADAAPLLLISEESLMDLNSRLTHPVPMNRFRPNVVVKGCPPYAEDTWNYLTIGDCEFEVIGTCKRCIFTTIDLDTLSKSPDQEPLRTLGSYRKANGGIIFGIYMVPRKLGKLRLGDIVTPRPI